MFTCLRNFCQWSTCPAHPEAKCRVNPCGGCKVEFVDKSGKVVNCDEGINNLLVNTRCFVSDRYPKTLCIPRHVDRNINKYVNMYI